MINRDYILRLAEQFGRELSILMGLRERNKNEDALITIDELLFHHTGLTLRFINSLSEDMLLKALSPLGELNVEKCLWIAGLLKVQGEIYEDQENETESYYSYSKSLFLFLHAFQHEYVPADIEFHQDAQTLITKLAQYELSPSIKQMIFAYYEQQGHYAKAEDILFELLDTAPTTPGLYQSGLEFYTRLTKKSEADLQAGNLSQEEAQEGLLQVQHRKQSES
ncbi:MAG TPA: DUF6483 family protein [Dictyobacter sp.]|jgi:hypothetical protein|nr:DUF6483 family protein [Dictyobacter sp.]